MSARPRLSSVRSSRAPRTMTLCAAPAKLRILAASALVTALVAAAPGAALGAECPNEQLRAENNSTALPDCRAYELVTPQEKNGQELGGGGLGTPDFAVFPEISAITADGGRVLYNSIFPTPQSVTGDGNVLLASRSAQGWQSASVEPSESSFTMPDSESQVSAFGGSPDLSKVLLGTTASLEPIDQHTEGSELYLSNDGGTFEWVSQGQLGQAGPGYPGLWIGRVGTSNDLSHIVFPWSFALLPEAEGIQSGYEGLYERFDGQTRLVDVNNNGSLLSTCGASLGDSALNYEGLNAVSDDGSRIFFEDSSDPYVDEEAPCYQEGQPVVRQLYVREDDQRTIEVSAPAAGVVDPNGPKMAHFVGATPNGDYVVFMSRQKLTANANTGPADEYSNLYEYDLLTGQLVDVSETSTDPNGAQVDGLVGMSDDGQLVYFIGGGSINGQGAEGERNLYLYDHGVVRYIATVGLSDGVDGAVYVHRRSRVTPDGLHLLFQSTDNLTSYQSEGYSEVYEYSEPSNTIICVSCGPAGNPPVGNAVLLPNVPSSGFPLPYNLSDDGEYAFFDTPDALVPQDTNGAIDVYEYHEGRVYLISGGKGKYPSYFAGATPSGSDVYFGTNDSLAPEDLDGGQSDIYDARVDGGFPAPPEAVSGCSSTEACRGGAAIQVLPGPATASFAGVGNLTPVTSRSVSPPSPSILAQKKLSRAQKLSRALGICRKRPRKTRRVCEARAREKYRRATAKSGKGNRRGGG
jgi:hypothetical protein